MKSSLIQLIILIFCLFNSGYSEELSASASSVISVDDGFADNSELKALVEQYKAKKISKSTNSVKVTTGYSDSPSGEVSLSVRSATKPRVSPEIIAPEIESKRTPKLQERTLPKLPALVDVEDADSDNPDKNSDTIVIQDSLPALPAVKLGPKPVRDMNKRFTWTSDTPASPSLVEKRVPTRKKTTTPSPMRRPDSERTARSHQVEEEVESVELTINQPPAVAARVEERVPRGLFKSGHGLFNTGLFSRRTEALIAERSSASSEEKKSETTGQENPIDPASEVVVPEAFAKKLPAVVSGNQPREDSIGEQEPIGETASGPAPAESKIKLFQKVGSFFDRR
ncbi:MAG: hypothetical protein P1V20_29405 [Verrucomicrobiales bacterium]|nr:hypothetical protein [Verrucomicrobiales bacterium]